MEKMEELLKISEERKFTTLDILNLIQALSEIYAKEIKAQQEQINKIDKHLGGVLYE